MRRFCLAAGILSLVGCRFDTDGLEPSAAGADGGGEDASSARPDAGTAPPPDAAPGQADATPTNPDAAPEPTGLEPTGGVQAVGGPGSTTGGDPFTADCPDGRVVFGFDAEDNDFGLTQIRAICRRVVLGPGGPSLEDPGFTDRHGSETDVYDIEPVSCPQDEIVVGFSGSHSSDELVHHLQLDCAPLTWDGSDYGLGTEQQSAVLGSPSGFASGSWDCGSGRVAGGFQGRAGSILDRFELRCVELEPVY